MQPGRSRRLGARRVPLVAGTALGVAAAGLGAVAAVGALQPQDRTVTLVVDGVSRQLRTPAHTVSDALLKAGLTVGPHDVVAPGADSRLSNHETIVLRHGRLLELTVGTTKEAVWTTATTVSQALDELGLDQAGAVLSASRSRPLTLAGASLLVRLPQRVTVLHDGVASVLTTTAPTVRALFAGMHLTLVQHDRSSVPLTTYPLTGMVVRVTRIRGGRQMQTQQVARVTERIADAGLYTGHSQVSQAGQTGVVQLVYSFTLTNGHASPAKLVSRRVVTPMIPEVIDIGTRPLPPPPPAPVYGNYGSGSGLDWSALAGCESGGNPRSVGGGGEYFGLYQFSLGTWAGVGGSGNPADASSSEQTYRAERLYASSGRSAWPVCGRYL